MFRGRRVDCSQHVRSSQKQIHLAREVPSAIMSLPDNLCSLRPLDKDLSECGDSAAASEVLASGDFPCSSTIVAKQDCQVNSSSILVLKSSKPISCGEVETLISHEEMRHTSTSLVILKSFTCEIYYSLNKIFRQTVISFSRISYFFIWELMKERPENKSSRVGCFFIFSPS